MPGSVGIEGLSRYGKAALVAMAYEPRFAIGFIGSSGEGGAKLHRRNFGELVENVAGSGEYHWMAGNFLKYAGPLTWNDLPVDAHELIALCAPRPTFISYGASQGPGAEGSGSTSGDLHGRGRRRSGVPAPGQEGPGNHRVPAGRDRPHRRRARLPPASRRAHHRPELADIPDVRRAVHQESRRRPGEDMIEGRLTASDHWFSLRRGRCSQIRARTLIRRLRMYVVWGTFLKPSIARRVPGGRGRRSSRAEPRGSQRRGRG